MTGPRMKENTGEPEVDYWQIALAETRRAIRDGTLRELAQTQSLSSPRLVEHMRFHDKLMAKQKGILSQIVDSKRALRIHSLDEHNDPIITDWIQFISEEYIAPTSLDKVLVLLPCSARKPYSYSRSHRAFRRSMGHNSAHEVIVTSPLGIVPRDLEECWPAGHYDVPVTGDWSQDEVKRIHSMIDRLVERVGYRVIINHSGLDYSHNDIEVIDTRINDSATSNDALKRLNEAVLESVKIRSRSQEKLNLDNFSSVSRLHHLNDKWLKDASIRGRFPRWKIFVGEEQIAMWAPDRGGLSLSKAAISLLDEHNSLPRIYLKDGVKWKGDVNLAILETWDEKIRFGQDLLVMQGSELLGLARAAAPAWEWRSTPGRLAKMHQRL
jgi:archaeosine synthase